MVETDSRSMMKAEAVSGWSSVGGAALESWLLRLTNNTHILSSFNNDKMVNNYYSDKFRS